MLKKLLLTLLALSTLPMTAQANPKQIPVQLLCRGLDYSQEWQNHIGIAQQNGKLVMYYVATGPRGGRPRLVNKPFAATVTNGINGSVIYSAQAPDQQLRLEVRQSGNRQIVGQFSATIASEGYTSDNMNCASNQVLTYKGNVYLGY